jgi:hypothetical protein
MTACNNNVGVCHDCLFVQYVRLILVSVIITANQERSVCNISTHMHTRQCARKGPAGTYSQLLSRWKGTLFAQTVGTCVWACLERALCLFMGMYDTSTHKQHLHWASVFRKMVGSFRGRKSCLLAHTQKNYRVYAVLMPEVMLQSFPIFFSHTINTCANMLM